MSRRLICGQQQPPRFPGFGRWLRGILLHGESQRVPWLGHGMGMVLGTPVTCCPTTMPRAMLWHRPEAEQSLWHHKCLPGLPLPPRPFPCTGWHGVTPGHGTAPWLAPSDTGQAGRKARASTTP